MKKILKLMMIFGVILVLSAVALIDFTPKADINMQNRHSIFNVSDINGTGTSTFNADTFNATNLKAENLEQNIDATGYNITAIDEVASNLIDTTNLEADNLESNLDATGYNITAIDEVAATLIDTTNLEADNLESDLDGSGYNITAEFKGFFYGWYDWVINNNSEYLAFNGSDLDFNEGKLNETIADYNDSMKTYVDAQDAAFNDSMKTYVDNENASMSNYVDAQDTSFNDSMKTYVDNENTSMSSYVDSQDSAYNTSMKIYIDNENASMSFYVDAQDDTFNTSMKTYVDATFITQTNEGNLDVNSSLMAYDLENFNTTTIAEDDDGYITVVFSWLTGLFIELTDSFSGDVTGTYDATVVNQGFNQTTDLETVNSSFIDQNTSDHTSFVADNLSGNITWTDNYGYPAACPSGSAITQLDDSVTCTDSWLDSTGNEIVSNEVNFTGNVTSNAYYAEIWFHSSAGETTTISTQNEYVNLTGFNTSSIAGQKLNGFSWNNDTEDLTVNVAGHYEITYDVSAGNSGVNNEMQFTIQVNGINQSNSVSYRKIGTGGDVGNSGDTSYIDLAVNDIVELVVRNNDATTDLISYAVGVNIMRIAD